MNYEQFFAGMSNEQLRDKADDIYDDLIDAVEKVPQSDWHATCFAAMYAACAEMQRRGMKPPEKQEYMQ